MEMTTSDQFCRYFSFETGNFHIWELLTSCVKKFLKNRNQTLENWQRGPKIANLSLQIEYVNQEFQS